MKKFIVKVQIPIASTEDGAPMLIYNEDRSIHVMPPYDVAARKSFKEIKCFRYAHITAEGILVIGGDAPWQDW